MAVGKPSTRTSTGYRVAWNAVRKLRASWLSLLVAGTSIATLTVLSIRVFLFGNSLYEYADQTWPLSSSRIPTGVFSLTLSNQGYVNFLQLTRDVVTWPYAISAGLTPSTLVQEKVFIAYTFALFLTVAYILATFIAREVDTKLERKSSALERESLRLLIVLFIFANFYTMNYAVDGGLFTDSLIVLFLTGSVLLILHRPAFSGRVLVVSGLTGLSALLDPSLFVGFVVAIVIVYACSTYLNHERFVSLCKNIVSYIVITLPVALYVLYGVDSTFTSTGPYAAYRPLTVASLAGLSANLTPFSSLRLLGYSWSTMTFAPPTVLFSATPISGLPAVGYPAQVLVPAGAVTALWLLAASVGPVMAFSSLLYRRFRKIVLPASLISLLGLAITQYPSSPALVSIASAASSAPVIGPSLGTVLAVPDHFLAFVLCGYILMVPFGVVGLSQALSKQWVNRRAGSSFVRRIAYKYRRGVRQSSNAPPRSPSAGFNGIPSNSSAARVAVTVAICVLVLFAGWQSLNGSYYPSRSWPSYNQGNGVPSSAPFEGATIPASVDEVYQYLVNANGDSSVFWPTKGATALNVKDDQFLFSESDAPRPLSGLPALPYLVQNNLSSDLSVYLSENNVGYVVAQNTSPSLLDYDYGVSSFGTLLSVFNETPGLTLIQSYPGIDLYQVESPSGSLWYPSSVLDYSGSSPIYSVAYSLLNSMGLPTSITQSDGAAPSLTFDNGSGDVDAVDPGFVALAVPQANASTSTIEQSRYITSPTAGPISSSQVTGNYSGVLKASNVAIGNWTLADWGSTPLSVNFTNNTFTWSSAASVNAATLSFNGTLSSGPGGIRVVLPGEGPLVVQIGFEIRESLGYSGGLDVYSIGLTKSYQQLRSWTTALPINNSWTPVSVTTLLSGSPQYFSAVVQSSDSVGTVQISNITINWNDENAVINVTQGNGLISMGNWSLTNWDASPVNVSYTAGKLSWSSGSTNVAESLSYNGTLSSDEGGIEVPNRQNDAISANISFDARIGASFSGSVGVYGLAFDQSGGVQSTPLEPIAASGQWQQFVYPLSFGPGVTRFTFRLQSTDFAGTIEIADLNLSWSFLPSSGSAPFGSIYQNSRGNVTIPFGGDSVNVLASGSGYIGPNHLKPGRTPSWIHLGPTPTVSVNGDVDIFALIVMPSDNLGIFAQKVAEYTGTCYPDVVLETPSGDFSPIVTVDGSCVFVGHGVQSKPANVGFTNSTLIQLTYPIVILWIMFLLAIGIRRNLRVKILSKFRRARIH